MKTNKSKEVHMSKKEVNRFEMVRSIIDSTDDLEMITACQGLLRDLIEISSLEDRVEKIRENMYKEDKRKFYSFFVENLPAVEISALADKCSGRVRFLNEKNEREESKKKKQKEESEKA
jgi:hypothetical protein